MSKLIVGAFDAEKAQAQGATLEAGGLIRVSSRNPEWGTIMLVGETVTFNDGVMNHTKRLGFVRDKVENLKALHLSEGQDFNAKLAELGAEPAKIIAKESLEPFFEGQSPKINPTSKEIIKDGAGNPIYYTTSVVAKSAEGDQKISTEAVAEPVEAGDMA